MYLQHIHNNKKESYKFQSYGTYGSYTYKYIRNNIKDQIIFQQNKKKCHSKNDNKCSEKKKKAAHMKRWK